MTGKKSLQLVHIWSLLLINWSFEDKKNVHEFEDQFQFVYMIIFGFFLLTHFDSLAIIEKELTVNLEVKST